MDKGRFIVIHEWMLELGLEPSELIAFALIWGTCRTCGTFNGGVKELCKWTGLKDRKTRLITKMMKDAGVLTIKGGHRPEYFIAEGIQANTNSIRHTIAELKVQRSAELKRHTSAGLNGHTSAGFYKGNIEGNIGVTSKKEKEKRYTLDDYEHDLMMHSVAPDFYPMPDKSRIYNGPKTQQ